MKRTVYKCFCMSFFKIILFIGKDAPTEFSWGPYCQLQSLEEKTEAVLFMKLSFHALDRRHLWPS